MALPKKRIVTRRRKTEELELYDYYKGETMTLRYVGRPDSVKDPGVIRLFGQPWFSEKDPLTLLYWGDMLTGKALEDAQANCGPKPEGFVLPDRFIKRYGEEDA